MILNYGAIFAWLHFFAYFCEKNKWVKYPSNHKKRTVQNFHERQRHERRDMPWACLQCVGTMALFATATLEYIFL